jgi:hypothetical protein
VIEPGIWRVGSVGGDRHDSVTHLKHSESDECIVDAKYPKLSKAELAEAMVETTLAEKSPCHSLTGSSDA